MLDFKGVSEGRRIWSWEDSPPNIRSTLQDHPVYTSETHLLLVAESHIMKSEEDQTSITLIVLSANELDS